MTHHRHLLDQGPDGHRIRLRTTNTVERLNKEKAPDKRNRDIPVRAVSRADHRALLIDQDEKWQVEITYLNMDELKEWERKQSSEQVEESEFAEA